MPALIIGQPFSPSVRISDEIRKAGKATKIRGDDVHRSRQEYLVHIKWAPIDLSRIEDGKETFTQDLCDLRFQGRAVKEKRLGINVSQSSFTSRMTPRV